MNPTIFFLSTYPFVEPRHGGQIRLAEIAKTYQSAGFEIESLAIYQAQAYQGAQLGSRDIALDSSHPSSLWHGEFIGSLADFLSGNYACAGAWKQVLERLPSKIDVIHVEQPWLWPLAKKIQNLAGYEHVKLIYGSQNIEAALKRIILTSSGIVGSALEEMVRAISKLEQMAIQEADAVIAVSPSDAKHIKTSGARLLILGENGISPWSTSHEHIESWRSRLPPRPWPLYVASAHLPNYQGFAASLANSLYSLAALDTRLVLAGGCSPFVESEFARTQYPLLNHARLQALGVLAESDLAAVKSLAHAFMLPISAGGGTNIKTAEALYSGAYVIASPLAFRGYEDFLDMPHVKVAKRPAQFHQLLLTCLAMPIPLLNALQRDRLDDLLWSTRLAKVPKLVWQLIQKK